MRYDLSRISYRNLHDKIKVGCKIEGHGFFETEANNFMRGLSNCKLCSAKATSIRCRKTTEEVRETCNWPSKDGICTRVHELSVQSQRRQEVVKEI